MQRGDRVRILANGDEAVVRGPGTSRFVGKIRVAYPDGSQFHLLPEELEHVSRPGMLEAASELASELACEVYGDAKGAIDDTATAKTPWLRPVDLSEWEAVADFYGLYECADEAAGAGVEAFPRAGLVRGAESRTGGKSLCLASVSARQVAIGSVRWIAAARAVFFTFATAPETASAQPSTPWQPVAEAAVLLARCCSKRCVTVADKLLIKLLEQRELEAAEFGDCSSWSDGPLILQAAQPCLVGELAIVANLGEGLIRYRIRKMVASHFLTVLYSQQGQT